jgi:RHS repeat-associated protein
MKYMNSLYQYCLVGLGLCLMSLGLSAQNNFPPNIDGPAGLKVNSHNGNLYYHRTDLDLKGTGDFATVTFSFNSFNKEDDRGYGNGWTFAYGMEYIPEDGGILLLRPDGRKDFFEDNPGSYVGPPGIYDILTEYQTGKLKLTTKHGTEYFFDDPAHKKLTKIIDPFGNEVLLSYTSGLLSSLTNASGRSLTFSWSSNHLQTMTDANRTPARVWTYFYDSSGDLVKVTNPLGEEETYIYSDEGDLVNKTDWNGTPVEILYYENGQVKRLASCASGIQFVYSSVEEEEYPFDQTFVTQNSAGGTQSTTFEFDEVGNLRLREGNCCGGYVRYEYDAERNPIEEIDAKGNSTQYTYDSNGNPLSETDPLGYTTHYTYDANNHLTSATDPKGNVTSFVRNAGGDLLQVNLPTGDTEQFTYDAAGRLTSITDGNNVTISYTYDTEGNLLSVTYPNGVEQNTFDGSGNVLTYTNVAGGVYAYEYDDLDQVLSVTNPKGDKRYFSYDGNGNRTQVIDYNGHAVDYVYDELNRMISVTNPEGTFSYQYDPAGNLTRIINPEGHQNTFAYDLNNQLVSYRDGMGHQTSYAYDENRNLIQKVYPNGTVVNFTYDALNRLIERSYSGAQDNYSYDANGNLVYAGNQNLSYSFTYDAFDRLSSKTVSPWGKSIHYTYSGLNQLSTMTDPNGGQTQYTYDSYGRLSGLTNPANQTTSFTYYGNGALNQLSHANGTYVVHDYDSLEQLTKIVNYQSNGDTVSYAAYTYDPQGNRISASDEHGNHSYSYDEANRLDTVVYGDGTTEVFDFDGSGNRTLRAENGSPELYLYDAADRILQAGPIQFGFDANGNLIQKMEAGNTVSYQYDALNRLTNVFLGPGKSVSYTYGPMGNRTSIKDTNDVISHFFYDGNTLLMELDVNYGTIARYTSSLQVDDWISMSRGGNHYFYHKDGIKSVKALTNTSQTIVNQYEYEVFGGLKNQVQGVVNPFLYTGRAYDEEIGLYYYRTRFYDPAIGRFNKKDLLFGRMHFPLSLNKYTYVEGNPINYFDPFGLARIGSRPLDIDPGVLYDGTNNPVRHDHIWFDDGRNIGIFGDRGIGPEKNYSREDYRFDDPHYYDDKILIDAYNNVRENFGDYDLLFNNCQDFVREIIEEYHRLKKELEELKKGAQGGGPRAGDGDSDDILVSVLRAKDPNDIIGPPGYGQDRWVSVNDRLEYTIRFENDPEFANAPAQKVIITHPVDSNINLFSFRVGDFGFGDFLFSVPPNSAFYSDQLDVTDSLGVFVNVTAGIDVNKHEAFWIFQSIDPATGLANTVAPHLGFLPVNDTSINPLNDTLPKRGEGFVTFSVVPKSTSQTGDSVKANASIVFDFNAPLATNTEFNIIDALPPVSVLDSIPVLIDSTVLISVNAVDDSGGVGAWNYDLYVSENNGTYYLYEDDLPVDTAFLFEGQSGVAYCMYTRARDYVSNLEAAQANLEKCFAAGEPALTVNSPASGFAMCVGDTLTIDWSAQLVEEIDIAYSTDTASGNYISIATNISTGDSSYQWAVPATLAGASTYVIRLSGTQVNAEAFSAGFTLNALPPTPTIFAGSSTTFCQGDSVVLDAPLGYAAYHWSNGATSSSIVAHSTDDYTVAVTDVNGCSSPLSNPVSVLVNPLPNQPMIMAQGNTSFCQGDSVQLDAPAGYATYLWSTGETTASISVSTAGSYTVEVTDLNGCISPLSNAETVTVNPLPAQPVVSAIGNTSFCQGDSVQLNAPAGYAAYQWSNGETTAGIAVDMAGNYSVVVTDNNGCVSPASLPETVVVHALPAQPTVSITGNTNLCQGDSVQLNAPSGFIGYLWSNGATADQIFVSNSGNYSVSVTDSNACVSPLSLPVGITVNPNPPQPIILASGPTSFCAGDSVILSGPLGMAQYLWSNGDGNLDITVKLSETLALSVVDSLGCQSPLSLPIVINVDSVPAPPLIQWSGNDEFCEGDSAQLIGEPGFSVYQWSSGDTTQSIWVGSSGTYALQVTTGAGCASPYSDTLTINVLPNPNKPLINPAGQLSICTGDTVDLDGPAGFAQYIWSNGGSQSSIAVSDSGIYSLSVVDTSGCESPVSDPVMVALLALPEPPQIVDTTGCDGDSIMLSATGNFASWQWSTGDTLQGIFLTASDTVWVRGTDASGCTSPDADTALVSFFAIPDQPVISIVGVVEDSLQSSVLGTAYQWFFNDSLLGFNEATIPLGLPGDYQVVVFNGPCASDTSEVKTVVGLPQVPASYQIRLYPNPNEGTFLIHGQLPRSQLLELTVFNQAGQVVYHKEHVDAPEGVLKEWVDLSSVAEGVYIIDLRINFQRWSDKIVIQR